MDVSAAQVRKIRCDALPEGCSHCINQNLECYVTDRVTGRSERRGYLQQLEREKTSMLQHIRELEKLLDDNGVEVKPWSWPPPTGPTINPGGIDPHARLQWSQVGSVWIKNYAKQPRPYRDPSWRSKTLETRPGDYHLGVFSESATLSSMKGTKLSILGKTLDITAFNAPDMDNDATPAPNGGLYNKSLRAFLRSTTGNNPTPEEIELPSKTDAVRYSEWYFLMIWPFVPVLHKPSFMALVSRAGRRIEHVHQASVLLFLAPCHLLYMPLTNYFY